MDKDKFAQHYLKHIVDGVITIESGLKVVKDNLLVLLGYYDNGFESSNQYLNTTLNQESNGYQEIVSTPTTKTVEEIIREVKEMIIELQIKGSVREHRNGLLKFTSTVFGCVYGRTKEEIEKQLKEKIKQLKNKPQTNKKEKKPAPLLSEFYRTEYLPYKRNNGIKESTLKSIERDFRVIINGGLDKPLNRLNTEEIEKFLYKIPQTRKRQLVRGTFNNILTYAKRLGKIKTNPIDNVARVKHIKKIGEAISFQSQSIFFNKLFTKSKLGLNKKLYLAFLYLTGARKSEATSLVLSDVDFENNVLHIPGTKTDGSDRFIPLFPLVKQLLQLIKVGTDGRFFPFHGTQANHMIGTITKEHHLHELRHTFGTIAICVQKLDVKTVSLWMGHTTVDMTLNTYTHPEQLDKGVFFNGSLTEEEKLSVLRNEYKEILSLISTFLDSCTKDLPKN